MPEPPVCELVFIVHTYDSEADLMRVDSNLRL